jgi:hypothetical protein
MKRILSIIGAAIVLTACGGGGDDAPATTAEGFWFGTASTGEDVTLAILDNGETWGVYTSGSLIEGVLYGRTTSSGTSLSGSGTAFNLGSRTSTTATYSGTFNSKANISVRSSDGGSFSGTYERDYDVAPSLTAMAGTFTGTGVSATTAPQSASVTISSTGAITVPASLGCSASGTASPRPSGKNIFDVSVTFSGSSCALGNGGTATGIAYYDTVERSLTVLALNSGKTDGFIYVGSKP